MKTKADLVAGWLKKAESDELAMGTLAEVGVMDAAGFHAQQSAEKRLKALLIYHETEFPFTHNLAKLLRICAETDEHFLSLMQPAEVLTPYAVDFRYDLRFSPTEEAVTEAVESAQAIKSFVLTRLPEEFR